eukprot:228812-Prorocentrum_minimum.AAC.5
MGMRPVSARSRTGGGGLSGGGGEDALWHVTQGAGDETSVGEGEVRSMEGNTSQEIEEVEEGMVWRALGDEGHTIEAYIMRMQVCNRHHLANASVET